MSDGAQLTTYEPPFFLAAAIGESGFNRAAGGGSGAQSERCPPAHRPNFSIAGSGSLLGGVWQGLVQPLASGAGGTDD